MRKLFLTIFSLFLCILCYSQEADLSVLAGEWKWTDEASGEEFYIILKPGVFEIPSISGGGTKDCLIGGYTHIKNGTIVSDNSLEIEDTKRSIDYPIRVLWNYSVDIRDENIFNAKGEKKIISGSSRIEYISARRIRLILSDDHEAIYSSSAEIFPAGTSLPTNIILDRVTPLFAASLIGQNIKIGDTLNHNGNNYAIAIDTLGSQIRQNRQKTYPEYISIQNTGNKYIADNDYFDNPNSFKPSFIDMEGETVHLDINPSNPSEILEAKFFLMWHNNIMLSPNGGNIYRLGKFFHESLSKDLIQFIQGDKNYPRINDLVFRCIIGADGKTKQVQFLIPKDSFNKMMSYIDAEVLYTIEQALKNLLRYDINEGGKKYMQELSLKYFPFKMEYLGYYLEKYQSWYGN